MSHSDHELKALYDEYADPIYRFLYWQTGDPILAEDLTSDVFLKAWKSRTALRPETAKAWLYRVARNLLIDHYRKHKSLPLDEDTELASSYNLHEDIEKQEQIVQVRQLVARLAPLDRSVIILRFFENLTAVEVATILGKTPGHIRILQHRALKQLKDAYED